MKALRIRDWRRLYEVNSKGRPWRAGEEQRRKPLEYVRLRVSGPSWSTSYRRMRKLAGVERADAVFGLFVKLLEVAAAQDADRRGWILDGRGRLADTACIAEMTGFLEANIVAAGCPDCSRPKCPTGS